MYRKKLSYPAARKAQQHKSGRIVLTIAITTFCVLTSSLSNAQLPSLINLGAPLGQEVSPVYRVFGDNANEGLGGDNLQSGALAFGDFNGDGIGDLLVGAPTANTPARALSGEAYILYGGVGLPGTYANLDTDGVISAANETRIIGGGENYIAGHAVAAGDVNGDGFDDAIIAEPGVGGNNPGRVRVIYGSAGLPGVVVDLADAPSGTGVATTEIVGELDTPDPTPNSGLTGRAVAAGDVNGDGYDDLIVGAYLTDTPGGVNAGAVYVVFGGTSLPGTTITAGTTSTTGVSRILGDDAGDSFGWSVASGDVNGDGLDDVVAGAPNGDTPGGTNAGEVHVVYGKAAWPETVNLNTNGSISSAGETRILGDDGTGSSASADNFGWSVASGDVNSDGFDDVLVGAYLATPLSRTRAGEAYVIYGKASLPSSILNMNTSPNGRISTAGETRLLGATELDGAGFSVGAGDVDGDGRSEVLVGAWQAASTGGLQPGHVFLVPGAAIPAASNVDLASFASKVELRGGAGLDLLGSSAAGGADLNRDGYGDFVGSAPGGDNPFIAGASSNNAGYAAVVFGDGISATATAATHFAAGTTPLKGLGGRLSPGVRTWVSFTGGTAASKAIATLTHSGADIANIPDATAVDVAQVLWHLTTDRASWTSAHVILRYADSEVAGLDETNLFLYQAASPTGPWTAILTAAFDTGRNEASVDTSSLGYFAIAADTVAPALSIGPPSIDLTRDTDVTYTVTYSRATNITLSEADIVLERTGSATGLVAVSGTGTETRTVTLSGITGDGTIGISIGPNTASDGSGNFALGAGPSVPFRVDHTAPEIAIGAPSLAQTTSGPVTYSVSYSGASAVTLSNADVQLAKTGSANADVAVSGEAGSTLRTVTLSSITGDGTLGIEIAAGTATDEVGNPAPAAGPAVSFIVDNTPPTVTIGAPSGTETKAGPVTYTITYGGASAVALTASKVTLNRTGTADGTVAVTGTGLTTRTVTISNINGDGTLGISLQAGTATDTLGNLALGAGPSATFGADNTAPTVSIGAPSVAHTVGDPVSFTVTYSGATGISLLASDVSLVTTGSANGTVSIQGSGDTTRTVVIDGITGNGTLGIVLASGTATDAVGNTAPASDPSANFSVGSVDLAVSIGEPSLTTTTAGPVSFTITYTGADTITLSASDVSLVATGTATGSVSVEGTGTSARTVVVSSITGDGTLRISLAAGTASNLLGNTAAAVGPSAAVTVDNTAPTVAIGAPSVSIARGGPVTFTITYTGASSISLAEGNLTLNATGTANGTVSVSGGGLSTRTVTISNIVGDGTLGISIQAGTASDEMGNAALAAGPSTTFNVDNTAPTVSIGAPSDSQTRSGPVSFTIAYGGASSVLLTSANVSLISTGTATGDVSVQGGGTSTRTVVIGNITGDGTLGIALAAGTASDAAGNTALGAGPSADFAVDNTAPTVSIGPPTAAHTQSGPVAFTVIYEGATDVSLTPADVTLVSTGTAAGDVSIQGSGILSRTVVIDNISGDGTLGIALAAGTASDAAGNLAPAALSGTFQVDNTAPTVSIGPPSATPTNNGPVSFTVTFGGATDVSLTPTDVVLVSTGTAAGDVSIQGSGNLSRTVVIDNIGGDGTLGISLAAGTASDLAGNSAAASGPSTTFEVDNTAPTVSIGSPSATHTDTGPVSFSVTFGGATGVSLLPTDVSLITTGTATGTISVQGSGSLSRTVVIDAITGDGTLGIAVAAGTAADSAGNLAPPTAPSANFAVGSVELAISIGEPSVTATTGGPVTFAIAYTGADTVTLSSTDISLVTTGTAAGTIEVQGTGILERTVVISNITGDGKLAITVAAGTASNSIGNTAQAVGPSGAVTVDNTAPTVGIGAPSLAQTRTGPVSFTVAYADASAITLTSGNVSLVSTGTAAGDVSIEGGGISTRTVVISNITGNGTLGFSLGADTATDELGNAAAAAGPSGTFTVDNTGPGIAIGAPSASTTASGPVDFVITYSDATGITLAQGDVSLVATGTATGTVSVTGSGATTRTVTVSNITGNGTLAISIAAGTATDALGNLAEAAGPGATVTVQNTTFHPADINQDGKLNASDVQLVINAALGKPINGNADINRDGKVNAADVQLVINAVLGRF